MKFLALPILILLLGSAAVAGPNPQLTNSVASRLSVYGIRVDPARLTTAQAAALHTLLVSERGFIKVRNRAKAILRNPDFRD